MKNPHPLNLLFLKPSTYCFYLKFNSLNSCLVSLNQFSIYTIAFLILHIQFLFTIKFLRLLVSQNLMTCAALESVQDNIPHPLRMNLRLSVLVLYNILLLSQFLNMSQLISFKMISESESCTSRSILSYHQIKTIQKD